MAAAPSVAGAGATQARWSRSLLRVLPAFALSRGMLLLFAFVSYSIRSASDPNMPGWELEFEADGLLRSLMHLAFANDAGWYLGIARDGYEQRPFDTTAQANWAFFPAWTLLWRSASWLTGEWMWSGLVLANGLFLLALSLLHLLVARIGTQTQADHAVLFAAFAPSAYFFSLPHTESLFLCTAVLAFLVAGSGGWVRAGAIGALASAVRFNGLFLAPALAMEIVRRGDAGKPRSWIGIVLVPLGALAFSLYLYTATGNPLAFSDIQETWGRQPGIDLQRIGGASPSVVVAAWNPRLLQLVSVLLAIATAAWCIAKGRWGFATFVALTLIAPLATGTLMSMSRYLLVAFPIYWMLGCLAERRPYLGALLLAASAMTMGALIVTFAAGFNLAGA